MAPPGLTSKDYETRLGYATTVIRRGFLDMAAGVCEKIIRPEHPPFYRAKAYIVLSKCGCDFKTSEKYRHLAKELYQSACKATPQNKFDEWAERLIGLADDLDQFREDQRKSAHPNFRYDEDRDNFEEKTPVAESVNVATIDSKTAKSTRR